jgi:hypothetical protein
MGGAVTEEEEKPMGGAVRVANGTTRCAWVSGAWTCRRGEPMKWCAWVSGAWTRACVSVAVLKPIFKLKRGSDACAAESLRCI